MDPVHYFDATRKSDPDYWDPLDGATDSGWYFWTETWADRIGPFETEDIARWEGLRYAMILNGLGEFSTVRRREAALNAETELDEAAYPPTKENTNGF